ncbi:MAG: L-idonate 5-dehydrogenase [Ancalomicrobiaceae bacterium]|nr:L-idonate 5-dehydrogenase [Ancalomicrobiaceae bacterium]
MKTVVIHGPRDLRIEERGVGSLAAGEVLVDVRSGGICGSDMHYYNHGGFGAVRLKEPMILGHEVSGVIAAVAADVTKVKVGDKVAVNPSRPCRRCQYCLEGLPNQCLNMRFYGSAMPMPHIQGAFRQQLVCDAIQCEATTSDIDFGLLAMAEPFSVGLHATSRLGPLVGRRALITGCGPIGTLAIAALRHHGIAEIVATDVIGGPLARARKIGADRTINVAETPDELAAYSANKGYFDVLIECSGNEKALRSALDCLRPRATIVQLGLGGDISIPVNVLVAKELSMIGSFRFHPEFALAVKLISERRVDLSPVLTATYPLSDAVAAFDAANDRQHNMKVQIAF